MLLVSMTTNRPNINITNESENKMKYIGTNKREFALQILLKKNLVIKPIKSNAIYIEIFNLFTLPSVWFDPFYRAQTFLYA